ncbi:MAG: DUF5063 domain-containing protein [Lachnospiraceae bacterium]|nr:DUF5063 domain-containing protein [Prevotella sp.]MCM1075176.1 DUF5063 domain-containing protein [Ruminococcus sp.]MCM1223215.1 DUF5063 domain-containing protein [Lachnospiraceae bacterium]
MENNENTRGAIPFIALSTEYCTVIEAAAQTEKEEFIALMLKLIPRIYITISDIQPLSAIEEYEPLQPYLDADTYEKVRAGIAALLGEDDTYLETLTQDMQYSEVALPASVSEALADIYQPLLDCALAVRDSEGALTEAAVAWAKDTFAEYWGRTLTNVLRALHHLYYK